MPSSCWRTSCVDSRMAEGERYEGERCSWCEYADHTLEEGGLLEGVSDEVRRYIDYDQWARDLLMDYTVEHSEDGGVFVFRDL